MPPFVDPSRPAWHRFRSADGDLRCSDLERTEVANALSRHYSEGRLDEAELNERLAAVAAAKTRRDLGPVLVDLPPLGGPELGPGTLPPRSPRRRRVPWHQLALLVAALVLVGAVATAIRTHLTLIIGVVVVLWIVERQRRRPSSGGGPSLPPGP